ncbi:hypothetical protein Tco_1128765 [Tanacetum coccineum]
MSADAAITVLCSHLRHDLGVFHLRNLTWRLPTVVRAAPRSPEKGVYLPFEDEAPTPPLPPFFLSPRIRPLRTRAAMAQMRATTPSTYHPLLPSGTLPLLPIPLPVPSTNRRADILEADMPPQKRLLLTTLRPSYEVGESSDAAGARQPGPTRAYRVDYSLKDCAAVRDEIEVLRRERLAYEQESMETRRPCYRSFQQGIRGRVTVLETEALEAGARVDTLEDTGSSS